MPIILDKDNCLNPIKFAATTNSTVSLGLEYTLSAIDQNVFVMLDSTNGQ